MLKIYKSLIYNTIISIASFILFLNNYWQLLLYDFYIFSYCNYLKYFLLTFHVFSVEANSKAISIDYFNIYFYIIYGRAVYQLNQLTRSFLQSNGCICISVTVVKLPSMWAIY